MRDVLAVDNKGTEEVDARDFMRILEVRLNGSHEQKANKEQLVDYVLNFSDADNGKVRYIELANDLRKFDYTNETNHGFIRGPHSEASLTSGRRSIKGACVPRDILDHNNYCIQNQQKVPQNTMEKIEKSLVKVRRHLMRQYGNEQALAEDLKTTADSDKNGNLSVDEFKNFLIDRCQLSLIDKSLTKSDLEGFMSAFIYNAQGQTSVEGVAPMIFCKDADKMTRYLNQRYRANPPPSFINENLD